MTPDQAIAMLNRQLASNGEAIILRRETIVADDEPIAFDCATLAVVRQSQPQTLAGEQKQTDRVFICSPTDLEAKGWPVPPQEGDRVICDGITRTVLWCDPVRMLDRYVRFKIVARG